MAASPNLRKAIGQDIREMREAAELSQESIADLFGWTRDAVSKIERGVNQISVGDFVDIVNFLADANKHHPAVPMAARYRYLAGQIPAAAPGE